VSEIGQCALCGQMGELAESHIIPDFVGKWTKKTSATGFLRSAAEPNVRVQDLDKVSLLCSKCEERFSVAEKQFSERIFKEFQDRNADVFHYDEWLLRFVVSLNWRVAVTSQDVRKAPVCVQKTVEQAVASWSDYLLGHSHGPGIGKHYILFLKRTASPSDQVDTVQAAWYSLRGIDYTVTWNSSSVIIYSKLPGIAIVSYLLPKTVKGWGSGTRIYRRGTIKTPQTCQSGGFLMFLLSRALRVDTAIDQVSEAQQDKILESVLQDPARALMSMRRVRGLSTSEKPSEKGGSGSGLKT